MQEAVTWYLKRLSEKDAKRTTNRKLCQQNIIYNLKKISDVDKEDAKKIINMLQIEAKKNTTPQWKNVIKKDNLILIGIGESKVTNILDNINKNIALQKYMQQYLEKLSGKTNNNNTISLEEDKKINNIEENIINLEEKENKEVNNNIIRTNIEELEEDDKESNIRENNMYNTNKSQLSNIQLNNNNKENSSNTTNQNTSKNNENVISNNQNKINNNQPNIENQNNIIDNNNINTQFEYINNNNINDNFYTIFSNVFLNNNQMELDEDADNNSLYLTQKFDYPQFNKQ